MPRLPASVVPLTGARTPALPQAVGARVVPPHAIPVFDRAKLPRALRAEQARLRAGLAAHYTDERVVRFSIPKTKAYADRVLRRLLDASGLTAEVLEPVHLQVNDGSWGMPSASLASGVLRVDPELVAIMPDEDSVAAVIAHELAHHIRAHSEQIAMTLKRHPRAGGGDMFSSPVPSRAEIEARWKHEYEADALSLLILANAGYDPSAAIDALRVVRREIETEPRYEFQRRHGDLSHPPLEAREKYMRDLIAYHRLASAPRTTAGRDEVYQELARRHRPGDSTTAADLYRHYSKPR